MKASSCRGVSPRVTRASGAWLLWPWAGGVQHVLALLAGVGVCAPAVG